MRMMIEDCYWYWIILYYAWLIIPFILRVKIFYNFIIIVYLFNYNFHIFVYIFPYINKEKLFLNQCLLRISLSEKFVSGSKWFVR